MIGADTYPPDVNGAARFTARLAAGLADRGHQVHVVCPAAGTGLAVIAPDHPGVVVHRLPSLPAIGHPTVRLCPPLLTGPALRRLLDTVAPDIVHIHSHLLIGRALLSVPT